MSLRLKLNLFLTGGLQLLVSTRQNPSRNRRLYRNVRAAQRGNPGSDRVHASRCGHVMSDGWRAANRSPALRCASSWRLLDSPGWRRTAASLPLGSSSSSPPPWRLLPLRLQRLRPRCPPSPSPGCCSLAPTSSPTSCFLRRGTGVRVWVWIWIWVRVWVCQYRARRQAVF